MKKFLPTAACALFIAASIAQAQVVVRIGPPPRPVETIPPPPHEHPGWAWHEGYHRWDGHAYVWVPGYYVEPPHPNAQWVRGYWAHRNGGYVWVEGHWR
jgi:hypothetical protein